MNKKHYTINDSCIGCRMCVAISKKLFSMNKMDMAEVIKQPENAKEEKLCAKAANNCPVMAIEAFESSYQPETAI